MPSTRAVFLQEKGHDSLFPLEGTVHGLYTEGVSISLVIAPELHDYGTMSAADTSSYIPRFMDALDGRKK